jgi:hypothetical protein
MTQTRCASVSVFALVAWLFAGALLPEAAAQVKNKTDTLPVAASFTISVKSPKAEKPVVRKYVIHEPFSFYEGNRFILTKKYKWGSLELEAELGPDRKLMVKDLTLKVSQDWTGNRIGDIPLDGIEITNSATRGGGYPRLDTLKLLADGKAVPLFLYKQYGLDGATVEITGTITLRGPGKDQALPAVQYEIIESLVQPGQEVLPQLEAALGKPAAKQVRRWNSFLSGFDWEPKKVKPGDKIHVYFPHILYLSPKFVDVKVNGKVIWSPKTSSMSDEIILPAPADDPKTPLLRVRVWYNELGSYVPEGVDNVYILRAVMKK